MHFGDGKMEIQFTRGVLSSHFLSHQGMLQLHGCSNYSLDFNFELLFQIYFSPTSYIPYQHQTIAPLGYFLL